MTVQSIEKIYFMVHPLIYESLADEPDVAAKYRCYIEYEKKIKARWYAAIESMPSNEALVMCTGPKHLEEFVNTHLGPRGLVVRDAIVQQPELSEELLSPEVKMSLGEDLLAMFWRHGFEWDSNLLVRPVIARGWAERIKQTFAQRGLVFDPETVQAEGWGDWFDGCVAGYTQYLGPYLGLANPIEDNFAMTVPDARFLLTAKFLEMVPLERSVRLYLWKAKEGQLIAWFRKATKAIGEPSLYVQFPLGTMDIEVRRALGELLWPIRETVVEWVDGQLKVPIQDPGGPYIFAEDTSLNELRRTLVNATFVEGKITKERI